MAGLDNAIVDVIHAASFLNWANCLMLSLGEPTPVATWGGFAPSRRNSREIHRSDWQNREVRPIHPR
jgi:hypothetical protein